MPFDRLDEVIKRVSGEKTIQRFFFEKSPLNSGAAGVPHTLWPANWLPQAGSNPTNGMAGAVATDKSTTGAFPITSPTGGRTLHLLYMAASVLGGNNQGGTIYLVDRLAHANINNNQGTASFSPVLDATGRLAAGEGCHILTEVTTALTGANVRTFTYTNQDGVGSRVTPNFTTGAAPTAGQSAAALGSSLFLGLQQGDIGVRSIESTTFGSGSGAGAYNIVLVRPIAQVPVPQNVMWYERDLVVDFPDMPKIHANACLCLYHISGTTGGAHLMGELRLAEN